MPSNPSCKNMLWLFWTRCLPVILLIPAGFPYTAEKFASERETHIMVVVRLVVQLISCFVLPGLHVMLLCTMGVTVSRRAIAPGSSVLIFAKVTTFSSLCLRLLSMIFSLWNTLAPTCLTFRPIGIPLRDGQRLSLIWRQLLRCLLMIWLYV